MPCSMNIIAAITSGLSRQNITLIWCYTLMWSRVICCHVMTKVYISSGEDVEMLSVINCSY